MDKAAGTEETFAAGADRRNAVCLSGTKWGYIIRPGENTLVRAAYGEMAASFVAVLLGMAAYGLWLIPGSSAAADLVPFKIAGTVIFFVMAGMLYLIARRGLCYEVHVDLKRRMLLTARRNRRGRATPVSAVPIAEVESIFLQRAKSSFLRSRLCARIKGESALIELAEGTDEELSPLLQRLTLDLSSQIVRTPESMQSKGSAKSRVPSAFAAR